MVRKVDNAVVALKKLLECLLITYRYDAASGSACFVFDYPEKSAAADRAFVRIRFGGVSRFQRSPGAFAELQRFVETYSTRVTRAATVVQKIDVNALEDSTQVALWFGHSFGGVSFLCSDVSAEMRNVRAVRTGADEWEYHDIDDEAGVDFYEPFA